MKLDAKGQLKPYAPMHATIDQLLFLAFSSY